MHICYKGTGYYVSSGCEDLKEHSSSPEAGESSPLWTKRLKHSLRVFYFWKGTISPTCVLRPTWEVRCIFCRPIPVITTRHDSPVMNKTSLKSLITTAWARLRRSLFLLGFPSTPPLRTQLWRKLKFTGIKDGSRYSVGTWPGGRLQKKQKYLRQRGPVINLTMTVVE